MAERHKKKDESGQAAEEGTAALRGTAKEAGSGDRENKRVF
jgi:hypothetical protein